jgi:gas vesicle protein
MLENDVIYNSAPNFEDADNKEVNGPVLNQSLQNAKVDVADTAAKVTDTLADAKNKVVSDIKEGVGNIKDKYNQDIQPKVIQLKDELQQKVLKKKDEANTVIHEKVLDSQYSFKNIVIVFIAGWFLGRAFKH